METRTAGAAGGPGLETHREQSRRAPRSDPTGRFCKSMLYPLLRRINEHLVRWACRKYKRLRRREKRARELLARAARRGPRVMLVRDLREHRLPHPWR